MELDLALTELSAPRGAERQRVKKPLIAKWNFSIVGSEKRELKLIGLQVDEALSELEPFINSAAASGLNEVRIIHGLGSGRLRNAVREELKRHPLVDGYRPGEAHEGRDGATVVKLMN
jgi:DNA mismatch repair protein MutS2